MFGALSLCFLLLSALPLYRTLSQSSKIWWTPHALLVSLAQGGDRVEIYVRGKPLTALVQRGQILIEEDGRSSTLTPGDMGLRFNNWDRVRIAKLPLLLGYAAMCGAAATLFLLVVTGRLAYRGETGP